MSENPAPPEPSSPKSRSSVVIRPSSKYKATRPTAENAQQQETQPSTSNSRSGLMRDAETNAASTLASMASAVTQDDPGTSTTILLDDDTPLAQLVKKPSNATKSNANKSRKRVSRSRSRARSGSESSSFVMFSPSHFLNASDEEEN